MTWLKRSPGKEIGAFEALWCWFLHRRFHKRTGSFRVRPSGIFYDVICQRCGIESVEVEWDGARGVS